MLMPEPTVACQQQGCHPRAQYPAGLGHYDRVHVCRECGAHACWSCIYSRRSTPALACVQCGAEVRDDAAAEHARGARVHSFAHEVVNGDFSQEAHAPGGMARAIARCVLRNQLPVAVEYTRRSSDPVQPAEVARAARRYLAQYGFAADGATLYHTAVRTYETLMAPQP